MTSFLIVWILVSIVSLYLVFVAGLLVNYYFQEVKDQASLIQLIKNITIAVAVSTLLWTLFFIITYYSMK